MTNRTRIVLLGLLAVLIAVWGSSASLPLARSDDQANRRATDREGQPPPTLFDVDAAATLLRNHQRESPAPREGGRNPFDYARVPSPAAAPAPPPADAIVPPPPAAPAAPLFTLSGIADKSGEQGMVRTAVISGLGQLFFAKVGDQVTARYTVTAIGADAVELRDVASGQSLRLALQ